MTGRSRTEQILDAYLAPEADRLPDRVIDAALADIARTPQRRALRVPWRFAFMPAFARTTGVAAVALVAVVAAGGLIYINAGYRAGAGVQPTPTATPTLPPGITGWTTYVSAVHGFTLTYPVDWSVAGPATRAWRTGDVFPGENLPFADSFSSPPTSTGTENATVGLSVWEMPSGEGADLSSYAGLRAWARTFCRAIGLASCETFAQRAVPMCFDDGGGSCYAAILVPTPGPQYAFFEDSVSKLLGPTMVRVVAVAREDDHPSTARYGGSVALLKAILGTMGVWDIGMVRRP